MTDDQRFDNFIMNFELFKERIPDWSDRNFYNTLLRAIAPRIRLWLQNLSTPVPTTYDEFRNLLVIHDKNYWTIRDIDRSSQSESKPKEKDHKKSSSSSASGPKQSTSDHKGKPPPKMSTSNAFKKSSSKPSTSTIPPNILDSSGRLTQEEKDRRRRENLCSYCGAPGHFTANCPKQLKTPNTKARATATIEEVPEEEPEKSDDA